MLMPTVFKLNRGTVTNASRCNLAEGLNLKSQYKLLCHKNNVSQYTHDVVSTSIRRLYDVTDVV